MPLMGQVVYDHMLERLREAGWQGMGENRLFPSALLSAPFDGRYTAHPHDCQHREIQPNCSENAY